MKSEFIITSTLMAAFSTFDAVTRFKQTLATVESIREKVPNAHITVLESSVVPIPENMVVELTHAVDRFVNFGQNTDIITIAKRMSSGDIVKNLTELTMLYKFFKGNSFEEFDRIFKVSGRYSLNDSFDLGNHVGQNYVVGAACKSQFTSGITGGINEQYMLRLYSFDAAMAQEFGVRLKTMIHYMIQRVNNKGYADVEHLFYKFLPKDKTKSIDVVGVEGFIAPTGQWISN
jgi:hypothetical protein